jgi:DNA repair protein RadA/Sms
LKTALYFCRSCGGETPKWLGRCPACREWNSLVEAPSRSDPAQHRPRLESAATPLDQWIGTGPAERRSTGISPLDRVLGGGIVPGMGILIGGDPGIGKSTLLLQTAASLAGPECRVLYATGEESGEQIALRARRLGIASEHVDLLPENSLERILEVAGETRPRSLIIDSIQTLVLPSLESPAGSIAQVRESASRLLLFSKERGMPLFLIGHVTKEGALAGPKTLEHLVDTVVYFEGDGAFAHRILRTVKNRFGPAGEMGVFEMTDHGLSPVDNPSSLFLSQRRVGAPGSVVFCSLEGTLPVLVETQALVAGTGSPTPRRAVTGFDSGRTALLLAVLEKRAGLSISGNDVFLNVAGGIRLSEPAADLPVACAMASSLLNRSVPADTVVFGEVGLAGEVRGVHRAAERVREAGRMGFRRCLLPHANLRDLPFHAGVELTGVASLAESIESLL